MIFIQKGCHSIFFSSLIKCMIQVLPLAIEYKNVQEDKVSLQCFWQHWQKCLCHVISLRSLLLTSKASGLVLVSRCGQQGSGGLVFNSSCLSKMKWGKFPLSGYQSWIWMFTYEFENDFWHFLTRHKAVKMHINWNIMSAIFMFMTKCDD